MSRARKEKKKDRDRGKSIVQIMTERRDKWRKVSESKQIEIDKLKSTLRAVKDEVNGLHVQLHLTHKMYNPYTKVTPKLGINEEGKVGYVQG